MRYPRVPRKALPMPRYLLVADQTVTSPELVARVVQLAEADPDSTFALLLPAAAALAHPRRPLRRGDARPRGAGAAAAQRSRHRGRAHRHRRRSAAARDRGRTRRARWRLRHDRAVHAASRRLALVAHARRPRRRRALRAPAHPRRGAARQPARVPPGGAARPRAHPGALGRVAAGGRSTSRSGTR